MKIKALQRYNFITNSGHTEGSNYAESFKSVKKTTPKKISKDTLQVSMLYVLSILSIICWIISLKVLPFGDMFQFLLGAVVLSVNLLVFKYTKI